MDKYHGWAKGDILAKREEISLKYRELSNQLTALGREREELQDLLFAIYEEEKHQEEEDDDNIRF